MWARVGVGALVAWVGFVGACRAEPVANEGLTANMHRVAGRFTSRDDGFSVASPPGASESVTNGGDANHGVVMILGPRRSIAVYPEYAGLYDGDDRPCRRHQFPWEGTEAPARSTIDLGGAESCLLVFRNGDQVRQVAQSLVRYRGALIMVTLVLTSVDGSERADAAALRLVGASFRRVPITP